VRIAVIGDLHDHWTDDDVAQLNASDYHGVLFVGDLGRGTQTSQRISRSMSRLEKPTLVMPGNADAPHAARLQAEFSMRRGLSQLFADASDTTLARRAQLVEGVRLCGYSLHRPRWPGLDFTVVCGRPYSMGGPELAFAPELHGIYGIDSMEDSAKRLVGLVDRAETEALVFVGHNGPAGLGDRPTDPWGCDFLPGRADWGDPDLGEAVAHARAQGQRVLAVVAGHMHLSVKSVNAERTWIREDDGVLFVNPARVPRIVSRGGRESHHHVALTLSESGARAEEVYWDV
jgi:uncharacterized protein (TIGR04168 family)